MSDDKQKAEFENAGQEKQLSLVQEFVLFVTENKKWWLIPILLVLGLVGLVVAPGIDRARTVHMHTFLSR